ncbi:uncharacterized protein EI90DRAFT_3084980, partial [Cantharellus anzutake]|uniref:uncharacterized protein n=1 Tax=Cantharellus anzutake TaxID=1750568 RepID=UPI001907F8A5
MRVWSILSRFYLLRLFPVRVIDTTPTLRFVPLLHFLLQPHPLSCSPCPPNLILKVGDFSNLLLLPRNSLSGGSLSSSSSSPVGGGCGGLKPGSFITSLGSMLPHINESQ